MMKSKSSLIDCYSKMSQTTDLGSSLTEVVDVEIAQAVYL